MPSSPQPIADLLAALQGALTTPGVRWFLFGAQAAILYGVARVSGDIDVTDDLGRPSITDLVAAPAAAGFDLRIPDAVRSTETTRVLPFVHRGSGMPLDVVPAGPGLEEQLPGPNVREWTRARFCSGVAPPRYRIPPEQSAGRSLMSGIGTLGSGAWGNALDARARISVRDGGGDT